MWSCGCHKVSSDCERTCTHWLQPLFSTWSRYFWRTEERRHCCKGIVREGGRKGRGLGLATLGTRHPGQDSTIFSGNWMMQKPGLLGQLWGSGTAHSVACWSLRKMRPNMRMNPENWSVLPFGSAILGSPSKFFKTTLVVTVFEAWGPCASIQLMIWQTLLRQDIRQRNLQGARKLSAGWWVCLKAWASKTKASWILGLMRCDCW